MSNTATVKMDAPQVVEDAPAATTTLPARVPQPASTGLAHHVASPVAMLFQPASKAEAMHMLQSLAGSNLVPKQFRNDPWGIAIAIDTGHRLGYGILQSLQNICVINGKPTVYGDELLARCKRDPLYEYVKESLVGDWDKGDAVATCRAKRRGEDEVVRTFSKDDAIRAKLLGKDGPWTTYPTRMLSMRARGFALRDCFTDTLQGVISREEAEDYPIRDAQGQPAERPTGPVVDAKLPAASPADEAAQLGAVLALLEAARTPADLHKAAAMAGDLPPRLRDEAKSAYRAARQVADPAAHAKWVADDPEGYAAWAATQQAAADAQPAAAEDAEHRAGERTPVGDDSPPDDGAQQPSDVTAEDIPLDVAMLESLRRGLEVCESETEWLQIKHALSKADPRVRAALAAEYEAAAERIEEIQQAEDAKWANET